MVDKDKVAQINTFLQSELINRHRLEITAVEGGEWLEEAKLLKDSPTRRGLPLRILLRENKITGQIQIPPQRNGKWFIRRQKLSFFQKVILILKRLF